MSFLKAATGTQCTTARVTEHKDAQSLKLLRPKAWRVSVNEGLTVPKYGPWAAIGLCIALAAFLISITVYEIRLPDEWLLQDVIWGFIAIRTLLGLAVTGFISGTTVTLWLHVIARPQLEEKKAIEMSTLGKVLTGLAEIKQRLTLWRGTSFIILAALMKVAFDSGFHPYLAQEWQGSHMARYNSTFPPFCCFSSNASRSDAYYWQLSNGSYLNALTAWPEVNGEVCPWYLVPSILVPALYSGTASYSISGSPVDYSAIGAPARYNARAGPFGPIFGTTETNRSVLAASACLPVLTQNPVRCRPLEPVQLNAQRTQMTFGQEIANCSTTWPSSNNATLAPLLQDQPYVSWGSCQDQPRPGQMTFVMGALGINAAAYAMLMQQTPTESDGYNKYAFACEIDIKSTVGFRHVLYGQTGQDTVAGSGEYWVSRDQDSGPCKPDATGFDEAAAVDDVAMAIGFTGIQALRLESASPDNGGYPSLLTQMWRRNAYNFVGSTNSLEDSFGVAIGAALSVFWGMTIPAQATNYPTRVLVSYARIGRNGYWPVVFCFPFIACGLTIVALMHAKAKMDKERGSAPVDVDLISPTYSD